MARLVRLVPILSAVLLLLSCGTKKPFDGRSAELSHTKIAATLEAPLEEGENVIWCSSFLAAWKTLTEDIAEEDILLEGSPQTALLMNKAEDPRPHVPPGALYVAAGWKQKGVVEKICEELKRSFPEKPAPTFPDIDDRSFVAYAYLEANVKFLLPYFQNRKPLVFSDSRGQQSKVRSFGIRAEDEYAYQELRRQPRTLFRKGNPEGKDFEFAVDLCRESSPSQVVVARIMGEATLAAALERIRKEETEVQRLEEKGPGYGPLTQIGPRDILLVPDMVWSISHHFSDLERKPFKNRNLEGQRLDIAQQDIVFRLDRSGAELKSEAKEYSKPFRWSFVLDGPFLVYMKKRGGDMPYFVMWVDNAELLTSW